MNDTEFLQAIAREWVRLGGDSEGVAWSWKRLKEAVKAIEQPNKVLQSDGAKCSECGGDNGGHYITCSQVF